MAYEKYIRRNGKLYGPYTYHSKRVNGKVVSEYHGTKKAPKNNFLWIAGVFIGVFLLAGLFFWNTQFSGKVSLNINSDSQEGELLEGILSLSLSEGELIPASSKVVFDIGGTSYEYILSDIVSAETRSGNFYVEDKSISGSGAGYGVAGTKKVFSDVDFTLNILSESKGKKGGGKGGDGKKEKDVSPDVAEETVEVEIVEEEVSEPEEIVEEIVEEEPEEVEEVEEISEPEPDVGITGAVISGFFRNTFNAFLSLTGQVSLKIAQEVDGSVSFGESFTYDLSEGETAEIKSGSVKVNGEIIDDSFIDIDVIDNQVVVTTEYSVEEEGFGEEYIGGVGETISIDLSQLELEGKLVDVSFVYGTTELISVSNSLDDDEVPVEESEESEDETSGDEQEIPEEILNVTEVVNETIANVTEIVNVSKEVVVVVTEILTAEEKNILEDEYETASVEITKAVKVNDRVEVSFEIGDYSIEHSYSDDLSASELEEWIERDRIRLLKDIADELSKEASSSESVEDIVGSYPI